MARGGRDDDPSPDHCGHARSDPSTPVRQPGDEPMSVHRRHPLPTGVARGQLIVAAGVVEATMTILASAGATGHEGLVWWLGRQLGADIYVVSCVAPAVDAGPQHVFADET